MSDRYYITTPIYYVNDKPHIGHCYTTVVADVVARHQRARGKRVFFLTGTDEHADKVVTSAVAHGHTPQSWADLNALVFQQAFEAMGCSNDDFIRTTQARHRTRVEAYIRSLQKAGAIYKGDYTGWYDEGQEEYVPENAAREQDFRSAVNKKPLVKRTEPCYFFRLSAYAARLLELIERDPNFVRPESRRSEVLGRLRQGLLDVPVSRPVTEDPSTQWGIRVPGDEAHRIYVWIDALFNYLSVVDTDDRRGFWPAGVHLIGKDILWFHAVIWPALLMALKESAPEFGWVALPRTIFGHGWWISSGEKMSKSLGNFIDLAALNTYVERFGLDALRWYLASQGPLAGADADFAPGRFVEVYNADLANGIGNSTSRVSNMVAKYFAGRVPDHSSLTHAGHDWKAIAAKGVAEHVACMDRLDLAGACSAATGLVRSVDAFINATQPFKLAKTVEANPAARAELGTILYACAEALRIACVLMHPVMPWKMGGLLERWGWTWPAGVGLEVVADLGGPHALRPGSEIRPGEALFMRSEGPK